MTTSNTYDIIQDASLADWALNVSQRCVLGHIQNWRVEDIDTSLSTFEIPAPSPFNFIGENLAYSSQAPSTSVILQLTDAWINEGFEYGYGTIDGTEMCAAANDACGHFTQVQSHYHHVFAISLYEFVII